MSSLEDLFAKYGLDLSKLKTDKKATVLKNNICHCGTVQEALDVAYAAVRKSIEVDCVLWAAQVHLAQAIIISTTLFALSGKGDMEESIHKQLLAHLENDKDFHKKIIELAQLSVSAKSATLNKPAT